MSKSTLAIIPARGGSKRVPNKNIREVAGKPLIVHTVNQAQEADTIDRAIVSTDSEEIMQAAEKHGGNVPFQRPPELASDTASMADVVTHALDWMEDQELQFDIVCILQPTCPLRISGDIDGVVKKITEVDAYSALSISKFKTPPQWAIEKVEDGSLREFYEDNYLWTESPTRSQDLTELYYPNGAVFAATTDAWSESQSFYTEKTVGYEMPPERSFDIDEPWELDLIKKLIE